MAVAIAPPKPNTNEGAHSVVVSEASTVPSAAVITTSVQPSRSSTPNPRSSPSPNTAEKSTNFRSKTLQRKSGPSQSLHPDWVKHISDQLGVVQTWKAEKSAQEANEKAAKCMVTILYYSETYDPSTQNWCFHSPGIPRSPVLSGATLIYHKPTVKRCLDIEKELVGPALRFSKKRPLDGLHTAGPLKRQHIMLPSPAFDKESTMLTCTRQPPCSPMSDSSSTCSSIPDAAISPQGSQAHLMASTTGGPPVAQLTWPGGLFFYEVERGLDVIAGRARNTLKEDAFCAVFKGASFNKTTVHAHKVLLVSATAEERNYFRGLGHTPKGLWSNFITLKRQAQRHLLSSFIKSATNHSTLVSNGLAVSPAAADPDVNGTPATKAGAIKATKTSNTAQTGGPANVGCTNAPTPLVAPTTRLHIWEMSMDFPDNVDEELQMMAAQEKEVDMDELRVPRAYTPPDRDAVPANVSDEYITTDDGKYDTFKIILLASAGHNPAGDCNEETFLLEKALQMVSAGVYLGNFLDALHVQPGGTLFYPMQIASTFIADSPKDDPAGHFFHCQQPYDQAQIIRFHGANALQADPTPGSRLSKTIEAFIHFSDVHVKEPETYLGIQGVIVEDTFKIVGIGAYRKNFAFRLGNREDRHAALGRDLAEVASFHSQHDCSRICQHLGLAPYPAQH
ncbi:hypothetical protein BOTBODRAFT_46237 [Botryobasidium botryosum FD-172 SS1]|uniref:Uncharacterized protein n=1 Tax=Botryobasidium botryosum (strain FD-172 SS1) TaxID=930990 RepID=A0A067M7T6_BOTB1|nr:hypothetical protein BOTBODRAFT_46237 [Botryobasidium botryosum FD-172 SS1]